MLITLCPFVPRDLSTTSFKSVEAMASHCHQSCSTIEDCSNADRQLSGDAIPQIPCPWSRQDQPFSLFLLTPQNISIADISDSSFEAI